MRGITGYRRPEPGTQPKALHPAYKSTIKRAPSRAPVVLPHTLSEVTGPVVRAGDGERQGLRPHPRSTGDRLGERIVVSGRRAGRGRSARCPAPWSRSGRRTRPAATSTRVDQHDAPLDPNFTRLRPHPHRRRRPVPLRDHPARRLSLAATTTMPGGPHTSISRCSGRPSPRAWSRRCTSPATRCSPIDPIFNCTADETARERLISAFDWETTCPGYALGYRFDIVLGGRRGHAGGAAEVSRTPRPPRPWDRSSRSASPG